MTKSRFSEEMIIAVLKQAEAEYARLKRMYAELSLTHHALQDAVEKKL